MLAGLLCLVSLLRDGILFPHNRIQVAFPAIGTLMEDDPVKLQGVQVGRVSKIESRNGTAIATLDLFHQTPITQGSRFINFNYSLFGARMVILVPGDSKTPIDKNAVQQGDFSSGVAETIHKVEGLLVTVLEYKKLITRLEMGSDTSMSVQELLSKRVYPVLEEFGAFTRDMEALQSLAGAHLDRLTKASADVNRFGHDLSVGTDTLVLRANRTLGQLAILTAQATVVLKGLEDLLIASQDTSKGANRFLAQRELYDQALSLTHALQDLLKIAKKDGLKDAIHFWRNVHIRWGKPKP